MTLPAIRVAVVEDDRLTRDGLRVLIDGTPGFACVGAARSVEEVMAARMTAPDVLLLDVHLPGMSGTDAVPGFRERWPDAVILMLTVYAEESWIFASLCNGASGYLLKRTAPERLIESIREARDGGSPMSPTSRLRLSRSQRRGQRI